MCVYIYIHTSICIYIYCIYTCIYIYCIYTYIYIYTVFDYILVVNSWFGAHLVTCSVSFFKQLLLRPWRLAIPSRY